VLKAFFASGHAVDLVLVVILAEFVFLSTRRRRLSARPPMTDRVLAFAPGICLLLALRAALTDAGWLWIAAALAASFPFHLADLVRRRL